MRAITTSLVAMLFVTFGEPAKSQNDVAETADLFAQMASAINRGNIDNLERLTRGRVVFISDSSLAGTTATPLTSQAIINGLRGCRAVRIDEHSGRLPGEIRFNCSGMPSACADGAYGFFGLGTPSENRARGRIQAYAIQYSGSNPDICSQPMRFGL